MKTLVKQRPLATVDWTQMVLMVLGFWLSASFLLDAVIVPVLFSTGMMAEQGFISAGYVLFGVFNRLELVCAALVLTTFIGFWTENRLGDRSVNAVIMASMLFNIALISTYALTPQISGWGLEMETMTAVPTMPTAMIWLHGLYWTFELTKLGLGLTLWRWCYQKNCAIA